MSASVFVFVFCFFFVARAVAIFLSDEKKSDEKKGGEA